MKFMLYLIEMIVGICLICAGSVLGIIADVGQTSSTALCFVLSGITGIRIGIVMIILYSCFLMLQFALFDRRFVAVKLIQMIPTLLHGVFLNFFKYDFALFQAIRVSTYVERLMLFTVALCLISIGFSTLKCSNFVSYPPESFCYDAARRLGIRFGSCKIMLDATYVILALLFCVAFGSEPRVIREGTLIFVLCDGILINRITPRLSELFGWLETQLDRLHPVSSRKRASINNRSDHIWNSWNR